METQLQKYNGKNQQNNEVLVDFQNKSIKFKPESEYKTYLDLALVLSLLTITPITIITIMYITINIIQDLIPLSTPKTQAMIITGIAAIITLTITLTCSFTILLRYSKTFSEEIYPKYNATLVMLIHLITFRKAINTKTIPYTEINKKVIITENFHNVFLKYELTDDVSKQIKTIHIKKSELKDWEIHITLTQKPKSGHIKLYYI